MMARPSFGQAPTQKTCFVAIVVVVVGPLNGQVSPIRLLPKIGPPVLNEHVADTPHEVGGFGGVSLEDGR